MAEAAAPEESGSNHPAAASVPRRGSGRVVKQQGGLVAGSAQGGGDVGPGADEADGRVVEKQPPAHLLRQSVRLVVVPAVRHHTPAASTRAGVSITD